MNSLTDVVMPCLICVMLSVQQNVSLGQLHILGHFLKCRNDANSLFLVMLS